MMEDGNVQVAQVLTRWTTTNGQTQTEDMQFIETVEAMDIIATTLPPCSVRPTSATTATPERQPIDVGGLAQHELL